MTAEIESILERFHMRQTEELSESVCRIMSYLESTEQVIVITLSGKVYLLKF